jgi:hypothetical protein
MEPRFEYTAITINQGETMRIRKKIYLVTWCNDWFVAFIDSNRDPERWCRIQAANDPKYESVGFRRIGTADRHYYRFFETDPGFKYFSELKYKGRLIVLNSIHPDAMPREVYVAASPDVPPPEVEKWEYHPRDGYYRYIRIDELEMTEIPAPDWTQIK